MKLASRIHIAVDLGASSGRVLACSVDGGELEFEEIARFPNGAVQQGGQLAWNLLELWKQITQGLAKAAERFGEHLVSVGVATWGVDFILLDKNQDQLGACVSHRDSRTVGTLEKAFERLPRSEIFCGDGASVMEINSVYQLFAMRLADSPQLDVARHFLMVPDYFNWMLSGKICNEFTNASTTQLLSPESKQWSSRVLDALGIPRQMFGELVFPGTILGPVQKELRERLKLPEHMQVVVPATHDTGSAVLAVPAQGFAESSPDWCYISCGTWSLMGAELGAPNFSEACQRFNFTNEGGVEGSVRLLKNIGGLWVAQQCREQMLRDGMTTSWDELIELAKSTSNEIPIVDPDAEELRAPSNMLIAINRYCERTKQAKIEDPGTFIRAALEGLALRYRLTLEMLEEILGTQLRTIHIVGGGGQNELLCQLTADICEREVVVGPIEATAIGNVMMQAVGLGEFPNVEAARRYVRENGAVKTFTPQRQVDWRPKSSA